MKRIVSALALTLAVCIAAPAVLAADQPAEKKAAGQKEAAPKFRPFTGKVKAVDQSAKSITLEGEKAQTFLVTSETRILKDGQPATFGAITVGEIVGGRAKETADGKWEATTVNVGKRPTAPAAQPKKEPGK
jgi:Cu/Ag efflux protein CusF